jgi:glycosyltransferase involved in cell wall biosynthesis
LLFSPLSVIAVSRSTETHFKGTLLRLAEKRVPTDVVYNAVETDKFYAAPSDRQRTRAELHLADDQFAFATIGQLTPRKGQLETIHAFRRVSEQNAKARLLIVGTAIFEQDQKYFELLKTEVAEQGLQEKVLFLGQRGDVNAVLAASDGVVVNSRQEPFGLVALEALSAGKPVVAASVDGIPELMKDGETGLLTPDGDEQALVDAMQRLMNDPALYEKLSRQGHIHVATQFTSAVYMKKLQKCYAKASLRSRRKTLASRN